MIGKIRARIGATRLRRSAWHLNDFISRVRWDPATIKDLSWLEFRRIVPAILGGCDVAELSERLNAVAEPAGSNLFLLKGLLAAGIATPSGSHELARAICSLRRPWQIPRAAKRALLRACETIEWESVPPELAFAATERAFRLKRSLPLWRRLLGEFARADRWGDIRVEARRHPLYVLQVRTALREKTDLVNPERILIAELIALARRNTGGSGRELARHWLLPLVTRSTGRFMERTFAAHSLSEQLNSPCHVSAWELADAVELGIRPVSDNDYSNFRKAFSLSTWERLHETLTNWAIFTELERFACEYDRDRYWHHIESKGARE